MSHHRQEGLRHAVRTEKVDREVPFKIGTIAQVIVKVHPSVVDQDIECFDFLDCVLNLPGVGHVQSQGRDAPIGMGKGLARTRIHTLGASLQGFLNQCTADASVRAGDQDCFVFDVHNVLLPKYCPFYWLLRIARRGGYVPGERFWDWWCDSWLDGGLDSFAPGPR